MPRRQVEDLLKLLTKHLREALSLTHTCTHIYRKTNPAKYSRYHLKKNTKGEGRAK